jgi:hypothetical protein
MADAGAASATTPEGKLKLHVSLSNATLAARGYTSPETAAAYARGREAGALVEGSLESLSIAYGIWSAAYVGGSSWEWTTERMRSCATSTSRPRESWPDRRTAWPV